jgi:site-specific recombinase XerD
MTDAVDKLLNGADLAPATERAYLTDWRAFTTWCHQRGRQTLPADPDTIVSWLADQARDGYATSTIARRLIVVRRIHLVHGYPPPTDTEQTKTVWRRTRRQLGTATRQVAPITIDRLREMVATCQETPAGHRDQALLVVGFAAALRRSEIAHLTCDDIQPCSEGIILTIRRSKTDQLGAGERLGLPHGTNASTCPQRTLTRWMAHLDPSAGPLFRPVDRHGNIAQQPLSGRAIAEIIKRRAALAGHDPDIYSGHSLRAGFATSAAAAGVTETTIARQTRHRSLSVLRNYIREGNLFSLNAATRVGL